MKDDNQLPEPELGYIQTDKSNQPAFSARQMREMKDTNQLPPSDQTGTQALWPQMIKALAEIDRALGLPDDGCNSLAQTLESIRALQARAQVQGEATEEHRKTVDQIMEQAQVFASAWALVGGRFDSGDALDDAHEAKEELREIVSRAILALRPERVPMTPASRDVIMATRTANADADEWPEPWAYQRGWNDAEAHHGITAKDKKEPT